MTITVTVTDIRTIADYVDPNSLIDVQAANELWMNFDDGSGNNIVRMDHDGNIVAYIDTPATPFTPFANDVLNGFVWYFRTNKLGKITASTASVAAEVTVSGIQGIWVSPFDGSLWCWTSGAPTTLKEINASGSTLNSYSLGVTPFDIEFDSSNNVWVTDSAATKTIRKVDRTGNTVTSYTLTTTYTLFFLAFDSGRNSIWIKTGGSVNGEIIEFDRSSTTPVQTVALNAAGFAVDPRLEYDAGRSILWFTNSTTDLVYGINTSDGSLFLSASVTNPTGPTVGYGSGNNAIYTVRDDGHVIKITWTTSSTGKLIPIVVNT